MSCDQLIRWAPASDPEPPPTPPETRMWLTWPRGLHQRVSPPLMLETTEAGSYHRGGVTRWVRYLWAGPRGESQSDRAVAPECWPGLELLPICHKRAFTRHLQDIYIKTNKQSHLVEAHCHLRLLRWKEQFKIRFLFTFTAWILYVSLCIK